MKGRNDEIKRGTKINEAKKKIVKRERQRRKKKDERKTGRTAAGTNIMEWKRKGKIKKKISIR